MTEPRRVLWVDDDADGMLAPLRLVFERAGLALTVATDLQSARECTRSKKYDAIVLDLILPDATRGGFSRYGGIELLRELRDTVNAGTPAIGLSVVPSGQLGSDRDRFAAYFDKNALLEEGELARLIEMLTHAA